MYLATGADEGGFIGGGVATVTPVVKPKTDDFPAKLAEVVTTPILIGGVILALMIILRK